MNSYEAVEVSVTEDVDTQPAHPVIELPPLFIDMREIWQYLDANVAIARFRVLWENAVAIHGPDLTEHQRHGYDVVRGHMEGELIKRFAERTIGDSHEFRL